MIEQVYQAQPSIVGSYIDNHLLSNDIIKNYNIKLTEDNVRDMIKNYITLQYKFINIKPPRITVDYQIRYENFTNRISDPILYYVGRKFDTVEEVEDLYYNIKDVLERLTYEELRYYNECLLDKKADTQLESELKLAQKGLSRIKFSCLLKFAFAFGIEELKKENEENEIEL